MPQNHNISKWLDLEGLETENIEIGVDFIIIRFHMVRRPHTCPGCGGITETVHDSEWEWVCFGRPTT